MPSRTQRRARKPPPLVPVPLAAWCLSHGVELPAGEYRFHPDRRWRFDWAWPSRKIAIEIHGSVWRQGRHTRGGGFEGDREKMNAAQAMGWRVGEFSTEMFERGDCYAWLESVMNGTQGS